MSRSPDDKPEEDYSLAERIKWLEEVVEEQQQEIDKLQEDMNKVIAWLDNE